MSFDGGPVVVVRDEGCVIGVVDSYDEVAMAGKIGEEGCVVEAGVSVA